MEDYEFPKDANGNPTAPRPNSPSQPPPMTSQGRPAPRATSVRVAAAPPFPPPPRSTGRGWIWFAFFLIMALGVSAFFNLAMLGAMFSPGGKPALGAHNDNLQEVVLEEGPSSDKIAVVDVEGVISGYSYDGTGKSMVDYIESMLERANDDLEVKAVLLRVDSPGGEVLASDDIYKLIKEFQEDSGKPVVCVMEGMAASGGYYVSAPCRWIVANELTMTGSIGVIMQGFNFRGLMDKVGVEPLTFKSGKMKDMLSSTKRPGDISPEERKIVQDFIDETFGRFKSIVSEGRAAAADRNGEEGRALTGKWEDYADGRLLSGKQAYEHGFIDELGDFDDAVSRTEQIAGTSGATLVAYRRLINFGNFFRLLGQSEAETTVKVDLGVDLPKLRAGQAYFLPAGMAY